MDVAAAYRGTRERTTTLVAAAGPDVAEQPVGACPGWTVRQVVSHLAGVCDDILGGRMDGAGTDPWTLTQVAKRADASLDDVLAEWTEKGPEVEALLADGMPDQLVFDTVSHEQDLRGALGRPGARASDAVEVGLDFGVMVLGHVLPGAGLPALLVRSDHGQERLVGRGEPGATLTASSYDLLRSFSGRRTVEQVRALDWGGADPTPWIGVLDYGPFTLPLTPTE